MTPRVVLASASPRRRELLTALGLSFAIDAADIDEDAVARELLPGDAAAAVARAKALTVRSRATAALILAADTMVVVDGRVFGKPADQPDAHRMLAALRGRVHEVLTAVHVLRPEGSEDARSVTTRVRMRSWSRADVERYVSSGGSLDKAGAYGVQDEPFRPVAALVGCRCNVVGLPLWTVVDLLRAAGVSVPRTPDRAGPGCAGCPLKPPAGASGPAG